MTYPDDIEERLGFDRIRSLTADRLHTSAARTMLAEAAFDISHEAVNEKLRLTEEMKNILLGGDGFPLSGYIDTTPCLKRIRVEGTHLTTAEMGDLRTAFTTIGELTDFFLHGDERTALYPLLTGKASEVAVSCDVPAMVERIIDRFGTVRDSASPELAQVRTRLREAEGQVGRRLRALMAEAQSAGIVDEDATISIRDGRAVIPVSAANKRKIKGFVHDESAMQALLCALAGLALLRAGTGEWGQGPRDTPGRRGKNERGAGDRDTGKRGGNRDGERIRDIEGQKRGKMSKRAFEINACG